jgi:hypothetical protein
MHARAAELWAQTHFSTRGFAKYPAVGPQASVGRVAILTQGLGKPRKSSLVATHRRKENK